jgi:hypothetical protein
MSQVVACNEFDVFHESEWSTDEKRTYVEFGLLPHIPLEKWSREWLMSYFYALDFWNWKWR